MDIELHVSNRRIERVDKNGNIPSGGINDIRCTVTFDFGSDWFDIPHITAIFARETKWAFQIEITPGEPFYVPASILARQGVVYASLLGTSSDGARVAQTTTAALLVEPNGLNRNTNIIYPLDQNHEYDTDAYAQYVAAVNEAANKAVEAAAKLEQQVVSGELVVNSYTKTESDEKYQKKTFLSEVVKGSGADISYAEVDSVPAVMLCGELPETHSTDAYDNPGSFAGVTEFVVNYDDSSTVTIDGFLAAPLYRLSNTITDYIEVLPSSGVKVHRNVQILPLNTSTHSWIDENTLRVDISRENAIDPLNLTKIMTNFGKVVKLASTSYIDVAIPRNKSLIDLKIAYPLEKEYVGDVSTKKMPKITSLSKKVEVKEKVGAKEPVFVDFYTLNIELNIFKYFSKKIKDLDTRVTNLERENQ